MIVVLDTNIWIKELALRSKVGSALRFFLSHNNGKLAVPEVVQAEVEAHVRENLTGSVKQIQTAHRQLLAHFGEQPEVIVPSAGEIDALAKNIVKNIGVAIIDVPFGIESAQSSLAKIMKKVPPSQHTQQFKDGVIWADCMRLLAEDDVVFATNDAAFFAEKNGKKELARNLKEEADAQPHRLTVVSTIEEVLGHVRGEVQLANDELRRLLKGAVQESIDLRLETNAAREESSTTTLRLFATENPERLYAKYEITVRCGELSDRGRSNLKLLLRGSALVVLKRPQVLETQSDEEEFSWIGGDGTPDAQKRIFGAIGGFIGHRTLTHSVRYELRDVESGA